MSAEHLSPHDREEESRRKNIESNKGGAALDSNKTKETIRHLPAEVLVTRRGTGKSVQRFSESSAYTQDGVLRYIERRHDGRVIGASEFDTETFEDEGKTVVTENVFEQPTTDQPSSLVAKNREEIFADGRRTKEHRRVAIGENPDQSSEHVMQITARQVVEINPNVEKGQVVISAVEGEAPADDPEFLPAGVYDLKRVMQDGRVVSETYINDAYQLWFSYNKDGQLQKKEFVRRSDHAMLLSEQRVVQKTVAKHIGSEKPSERVVEQKSRKNFEKTQADAELLGSSELQKRKNAHERDFEGILQQLAQEEHRYHEQIQQYEFAKKNPGSFSEKFLQLRAEVAKTAEKKLSEMEARRQLLALQKNVLFDIMVSMPDGPRAHQMEHVVMHVPGNNLLDKTLRLKTLDDLAHPDESEEKRMLQQKADLLKPIPNFEQLFQEWVDGQKQNPKIAEQFDRLLFLEEDDRAVARAQEVTEAHAPAEQPVQSVAEKTEIGFVEPEIIERPAQMLPPESPVWPSIEAYQFEYQTDKKKGYEKARAARDADFADWKRDQLKGVEAKKPPLVVGEGVTLLSAQKGREVIEDGWSVAYVDPRGGKVELRREVNGRVEQRWLEPTRVVAKREAVSTPQEQEEKRPAQLKIEDLYARARAEAEAKDRVLREKTYIKGEGASVSYVNEKGIDVIESWRVENPVVDAQGRLELVRYTGAAGGTKEVRKFPVEQVITESDSWRERARDPKRKSSGSDVKVSLDGVREPRRVNESERDERFPDGAKVTFFTMTTRRAPNGKEYTTRVVDTGVVVDAARRWSRVRVKLRSGKMAWVNYAQVEAIDGKRFNQ